MSKLQREDFIEIVNMVDKVLRDPLQKMLTEEIKHEVHARAGRWMDEEVRDAVHAAIREAVDDAMKHVTVRVTLDEDDYDY